MRFHQRVQTPNGPGIIQGWLSHRNEAGELERTKLIVSHEPKMPIMFSDRMFPAATIQGVWTLAAYEPDQVKELE